MAVTACIHTKPFMITNAFNFIDMDSIWLCGKLITPHKEFYLMCYLPCRSLFSYLVLQKTGCATREYPYGSIKLTYVLSL